MDLFAYAVTVKLPKDPARRPHPLGCKHKKTVNDAIQWYGHCGHMNCANYLNKCPLHAMVPAGGECNRVKSAGQCPVPLNDHCTDNTGEHHTVVVFASDYAKAEQVVRDNGFEHITRVEKCWVINLS